MLSFITGECACSMVSSCVKNVSTTKCSLCSYIVLKMLSSQLVNYEIECMDTGDLILVLCISTNISVF